MVSSVMEQLEQLYASVAQRRKIDNDKAYKVLWDQVTATSETAFAMALAGGVISDRMAWVFIAGYQAAIRATFDPSNSGWMGAGWTTFAVSESKKAPDTFPGLTHEKFEGGYTLSGYKTWIPGFPLLDTLIVKSGRGAEALYFNLSAQSEGLSFSPLEKRKALFELSQGVAHFEAVHVTQDQMLDKDLAKPFSMIEVSMILVAYLAALYGWCQERTRLSEGERIVSILQDAERLFQGPFQIEALVAVDQAVQRLMQYFKEDAEIQSSSLLKERALIDMYSAGLARYQPS